MLKHLRLLRSFCRISFSDLSEFRVDFFTSILHYLVYQALFLIFWKSILTLSNGHLGHWTLPELIVFSSFSLFSNAISLWFYGLLTLHDKVLHGQLDKYLCRPISPLFGLLAEEIRAFASLQQALAGFLIALPVALLYRLEVHLFDAILAAILLLLGSLTLVLIQGCVALLSFWLGDVSRMQSFLGLMGDFEKYPIDFFPLGLRRFLTWIIPIGMASTLPTLALFGKLPQAWAYLLGAVGLALIWALALIRLFTRALVRYESFGG